MSKQIEANYRQLQAEIERIARKCRRRSGDISLVAVSKGMPATDIDTVARMGQPCFGENRIVEGIGKMDAVTVSGLSWHMIGRIQSNKIRYLPRYSLIHSLDRWSLAEKMDAFAIKRNLRFNCLVQVNVAADPAKAGIGLEETDDFLAAAADCKGLRILGLMTITALEAERNLTLSWFEALAGKFYSLRQQSLPGDMKMKWLSMGMSGDYELAIAAGATLLRIGSAIFKRGEQES